MCLSNVRSLCTTANQQNRSSPQNQKVTSSQTLIQINKTRKTSETAQCHEPICRQAWMYRCHKSKAHRVSKIDTTQVLQHCLDYSMLQVDITTLTDSCFQAFQWASEGGDTAQDRQGQIKLEPMVQAEPDDISEHIAHPTVPHKISPAWRWRGR